MLEQRKGGPEHQRVGIVGLRVHVPRRARTHLAQETARGQDAATTPGGESATTVPPPVACSRVEEGVRAASTFFVPPLADFASGASAPSPPHTAQAWMPSHGSIPALVLPHVRNHTQLVPMTSTGSMYVGARMLAVYLVMSPLSGPRGLPSSASGARAQLSKICFVSSPRPFDPLLPPFAGRTQSTCHQLAKVVAPPLSRRAPLLLAERAA